MCASPVVICTATRYNSPEEMRCRLAQETCHQATKLRIPIVVIDGSDNSEIAKALTRAGATVFKQDKPGMAHSRVEAIETGCYCPDRKHVLWMEPEKVGMVKFVEELSEYALTNDCDFVIPARTVKSLCTYPPYQAISEAEGNCELMCAMLPEFPEAANLDRFFGPRLFKNNPDTLAAVRGTQQLGPYAPLFVSELRLLQQQRQRNNTLVCAAYTVDYQHPPEQTAAETEDQEMERFRDGQRCSIVALIKEEVERIHWNRKANHR